MNKRQYKKKCKKEFEQLKKAINNLKNFDWNKFFESFCEGFKLLCEALNKVDLKSLQLEMEAEKEKRCL